jgi:Cu(I)/Ag(I) efflux system periplasmic protein CusF
MKPIPFFAKSATLLAGALLALSAVSQTAGDMASGEVRKVDKDAAKITIKHGDIKSLDMPAMTMVFQVRDPALLDKVKPGDKVKFSVERRDGAFVVNAIESAP